MSKLNIVKRNSPSLSIDKKKSGKPSLSKSSNIKTTTLPPRTHVHRITRYSSLLYEEDVENLLCLQLKSSEESSEESSNIKINNNSICSHCDRNIPTYNKNRKFYVKKYVTIYSYIYLDKLFQPNDKHIISLPYYIEEYNTKVIDVDIIKSLNSITITNYPQNESDLQDILSSNQYIQYSYTFEKQVILYITIDEISNDDFNDNTNYTSIDEISRNIGRSYCNFTISSVGNIPLDSTYSRNDIQSFILNDKQLKSLLSKGFEYNSLTLSEYNKLFNDIQYRVFNKPCIKLDIYNRKEYFDKPSLVLAPKSSLTPKSPLQLQSPLQSPSLETEILPPSYDENNTSQIISNENVTNNNSSSSYGNTSDDDNIFDDDDNSSDNHFYDNSNILDEMELTISNENSNKNIISEDTSISNIDNIKIQTQVTETQTQVTETQTQVTETLT